MTGARGGPWVASAPLDQAACPSRARPARPRAGAFRPAPGEAPSSTRGLSRDEALDHVLLVEKLLGRDPDALPAVVVVLQVRHDLPVLSVGAHGEPELEAFGHAVLAVANHRERVP